MFSFRMLFLPLCVLLLSACDSGGSSGNNNINPPAGLSVSEVGSESVTLTWNNVSGAQSYRIYYASEPITSVNNIHAHANGDWIANASTPHTVSGLTNYVTYYFVATAVAGDRESGPSNSVAGTPMDDTAGPSPQEVRMIELINRARFDPNAEVARHDDINDLNQGLSAGTISSSQKPPVAFNELLMLAARGHSRWMLDTNNFGHTGESGSSPSQRIQATGYGVPAISGENISVVGSNQLNLTQAVDTQHGVLFESPAHRVNIFREGFREVGIGQRQGNYTYDDNRTFPSSMLTQKYARLGSQFFITGVIYEDNNSNGIYDVGEGLPDIVVTVNDIEHQAYGSGIYSIPVDNEATYTVSFSGGALAHPIEREVQVTGRNIKLDVVVSGGSVEVVSW